VLDDSQLDLIALILEEHINHLEQVLLSVDLSNQLGDLVQTFTQSDLDPFILDLQQLFVDSQQVALPFISSDCVQHCREVIGTTVGELIVLSQRRYIAIRHSTEFFEKIEIKFSSFKLVNEGSKVLVGSHLHSFVAVLEQVEHHLCELVLPLLLAAQLADGGKDINAGLSDDPVAVVPRLIPIELEESCKELSVDEFGDDWQLQNGLLPHLIADVFSQREQLQSNELLAQALPETFAHTAEQLHCHYPVILVVIVVGHFDHMLQHKIPTVLVVQIVSYFCNFFGC
jgi:hypothetical protein